MPDQKLTQLPDLAALSPDDLFYVVDSPGGPATSRKMSASVLDARYLQVANNLSDLTNLVVARASLGLGTLATVNDAPADGTIYGRQNNAWAAATGILPVVDTTAIVKGSADATKQLRFEVDGFTAGTTRVGTWPNADMTVAGLEVANIFTAAQTIAPAADSVSVFLIKNVAAEPVFQVDTTNKRLGIALDTGDNPADGIDANITTVRIGAPRTNNVNKNGGLIVPSYSSGFFAAFATQANSTNNIVFFGGGLGSHRQATDLRFLVNADPEATVGFLTLVRVQSTGVRVASLGTAIAPQALLDVDYEDATTNTIVNALHLGRSSSGAVAAGMGVGLLAKLESSTTNRRSVGRLTYQWVTETDATRASRGILSAYYTTTERECIRWEANSTVAMLGVLGAAAIARPAAYTLASTATRTMPTPEAAFTGQDNAQPGAVYAKSADLITLQTRLNNVEGVLRQVIIDLASTSGFGFLAAA